MSSAHSTNWCSPKVWLGTLCLLVLPLAGWAQVGAPVLELRPVTPVQVETAPGRILTLSVQLISRADRDLLALESLTLPQGWRPIIPPGAVPLPAGVTLARQAAILVPATAPAGLYAVRYSVRDQRDPNRRDMVEITVLVRQVTRLTLLVEEKPDMVVAGRDYAVRLRLGNAGNAEETITLASSSQRPGYAERVTPDRVTLPAGGSAEITLSGTTDAKERRAITHYVTVTARADAEPPITVTVGVEVLPLAGPKASLFCQVPTVFSVRATGEGGQHGVQLHWRGAGDLNEDGTQRVDFLLQGPDRQSTGLYGLRDAYHLNLFGPAAGVRLGDQVYGLSPLTEYFRAGRGAELRLTPTDDLRVTAFYLRDRWEAAPTTLAGVSVGQQGTSGDYQLHHAVRETDGRTDRLWSLEGAWRSLFGTRGPRAASLRAEVAQSLSGADGAKGLAYRAEFTSPLGRDGRLTLRRLHAAPDYLGYYRDCDYTNGAATFSLTGPWQGEVSYARYANNLDRDPDRPAPRETRVTAQLRRDLRDGWYAALGLEDFTRRDGNVEARHERPLRLSVGRSGATGSWQADYRFGRVEDAGGTRRVHDLSASASWHPAPALVAGLTGGYRAGGRDSVLLGAGSHLGGSLSWQATETLSLTAWYTGYDLNGGRRSEQGELSARWRLPGEQSVELRALTLTPAAGDRSTSYLLSYAIPLDLPARRRTRVGLITGRLTDAQGLGVAEAVLRLEGAAAVTDAQGRFTFPALPPGTYALAVDPRSIGLDRVPDRPMPMSVRITGGETTQVEIGVLPAATVSGQVLLQPTERGVADDTVVGNPAGPSGTEPTPLPNLLVELSNGTQTLRRLTDAHGAFAFDRLTPGRWHLRVYADNLPPYTRLAQPDTELTLAATPVRLTLHALPVTRRIKMLDNAAPLLIAEPVASAK